MGSPIRRFFIATVDDSLARAALAFWAIALLVAGVWAWARWEAHSPRLVSETGRVERVRTSEYVWKLSRERVGGYTELRVRLSDGRAARWVLSSDVVDRYGQQIAAVLDHPLTVKRSSSGELYEVRSGESLILPVDAVTGPRAQAARSYGKFALALAAIAVALTALWAWLARPTNRNDPESGPTLV
jgi:hypothetical protein